MAAGALLSDVEKLYKPITVLKEVGEEMVTELETAAGKTQTFSVSAESSRASQNLDENTQVFSASTFEPQSAASARPFVEIENLMNSGWHELSESDDFIIAQSVYGKHTGRNCHLLIGQR